MPSIPKSPPKVSVLMAVFNTAPYLRDALKSISEQSFADFELLVVDDGSTDGSTEILQAYARHESRLSLTVRENRGLISTRNELLNLATAELIAWMDSDDMSTPCRLQLQVERFDADVELVCLGGVAQCIDPQGHFLNVETYPLDHPGILIEQQRGGAMRFPTTMMRRKSAIAEGGFREPFRIGEDFDLCLRMSERGQMANLPETLYYYRQHLSSVCATLGPRWAAYRDQILLLANERKTTGSDRLQRGEKIAIDMPAASKADLKKYQSRTYIRWANAALINDNENLAKKYAFAAIEAQPLAREGWKTIVRVLIPKLRKTA